ncbi:hypothetical protein AWZ03_014596, partial [Drosophila navojoa]
YDTSHSSCADTRHQLLPEVPSSRSINQQILRELSGAPALRQSCRSKAGCKMCGQSHHSLLHLLGARRRQRRRPAAAATSGTSTSALAVTTTPQGGSRKRRRRQAASNFTREATPPLRT